MRGVGPTYAVATTVPLTAQNVAVKKRLDAQEGRNAMVTLGNKMSRALAKAKTPDDCRHVMRSMEAHIVAHKAAGMTEDVKMLKQWLEKCKAKCDKLSAEQRREEEETQQQEETSTDTGPDADSEPEPDTASDVTEEEKLPCASHVIVATHTSILPLSQLLVSDAIAQMQRIPPHPDFVLARVLAFKTPPPPSVAPAADPSAPEPVVTGDAASVSGKDAEKPKAPEMEVIDVSTYDQIPTERVPGYLAITGTLQDCPLPGVWHELPDARVQTPCAISVLGSSVLVADGHSARVIALPSGKCTEEVYTFYDEKLIADPARPPFKVFGTDMNATHVAFLGLTPGQYTPILIIRERPFLASSRRKDSKPRVTVMSFSVPCNTVTLSAAAGTPDSATTVYLGLSDGTMMRLPVPILTRNEMPGKQTLVLYPRKFTVLTGKIKAGQEDTNNNKPKEMTVESTTTVPFDQDGILEQLRRDFPEWTASAVPFGNGDHMRWSGETLPLHRIVVKGNRAVASGPGGIFVFKLDRQPGDTERAIHIQLGDDISSFDFRGGMMAILKKDATIQLVNFHTYKLESNIPIQPVDGVKRVPAAYTSSHVSAVTVFDERILFVHADGSSRALEFEDTGFIRAPYTRIDTKENVASSFIPVTAKDAKTKKKKKNPKKK